MKYLFISFFALNSIAFAASDQPGFLADFNYQVSEVKNMSKAQQLENSMVTDTRKYSICSNRAHLWVNDLSRFQNIQAGKVFIHFTKQGQEVSKENKEWAYHVAPYVIVNGEEVVLDPVFEVFNGKPQKISDWMKYFGSSSNCVVLDPANNPAHLALEKFNLGFDTATPLDEKTGYARQYPSTEGICYIRKVPMYYQWPSEIYGADLARTGRTEFNVFNYNSFQKDSVLGACQQATNISFRLEHSCKNYLGL